MRIPFIDLKAQYKAIQSDLDNAVEKALRSFQFSKGKEVTQFEIEFSNLLKIRHCIAAGNGTDALFISLKALGIQQNDEVITPAFSWISSAEVISLCGATPVFADVDPENYTIDPSTVRKKITTRTKAVIAVHLYGHASSMAELQKICKEYNLYLIEDCAQAHLTEDRGQYCGTFGDVAAFSFYPTKNLGAFGDAGCIVTNNTSLSEKIRRLSNHGALEKDDHLIEGMNSRMDTIQAGVLLAKLNYLEKWNQQRVVNASLYTSLLNGIAQVKTPTIRPNSTHTFHLYVIQTQRRDELKDHLQKEGIQTMIHYPKSLPDLPAYQHLGYSSKQDFPVTYQLQEQVLSLPIYPELQKAAIPYICGKIKDFYKS